MLLCLLFLGACLVFALAYRFYGGWMSRALGIDDSRPTPAHSLGHAVDGQILESKNPLVSGIVLIRLYRSHDPVIQKIIRLNDTQKIIVYYNVNK